MRGWGAGLAAIACLTLLGCGKAQPPPPPAESQWVANAHDVIDELQRDLALSAGIGDTVADARTALHADSGIYAVLVAYTDFGGCLHMVSAVGAPPVGFAAVARTLRAACAKFERAAALFTRATTNSDPQALLSASRLAGGATPLLGRARAQ